MKIKKYWIIFGTIFLLNKFLFSYKIIPTPFKVGEYMEFDVRLFNMTVAIQKVWVKAIVEIEGKKCYHIHSDIETVPFVSKIYHLHDIIDSYIEVDTLYPIKIETKIKEGSWTNLVRININREKKELHYVDKRSDKILKYDGEVLGLDSLIFFARRIEPQKNEKIKFVLSNGDRIITVDSVVLSVNDTQYIPKLNKKFEAILYQQIGDREVALWISKDKYRLPIRMISVRLKLAGYGITNIEAWITKHIP
jgi:hypothetical protein